MTRCPQCGSECGPFVCRFSGIQHTLFRRNLYPEAMIQRDKEQPAWLRALKQGAKE